MLPQYTISKPPRKKTGPQKLPVSTRFWRKVEKSDSCWIWVGAKIQKSSYGVINVNGKPKLTHRVSYELAFGDIPDGMCVLHRCDVKPCVNPSHLFIGTKKDNSRDMVEKGRHYYQQKPEVIIRGERHYSKKYPEKVNKGEKHGMSKLSEEQVTYIRQKYSSQTISIRELALEMMVSSSTIHMIISRKTWRHLM